MTSSAEGPSRRPPAWLRLILRLPVYLYRWHLGWVLGARFLLLTHTGRRTGQRYQTVLEVMGRTPDGGLIVMSGWGRRADWFRNIQDQSHLQITVGRHTGAAIYRTVPASEASQVLASYQGRNRLARPIINKTLSALTGWPYDGSAASQSRLADELPMVSFHIVAGGPAVISRSSLPTPR